MTDFTIVYEHKNREMESIMLIKYELEKRGYTVDLHNIYELNRIKYFFKKTRAILTPMLYSDYELKLYLFEVFGKHRKICNLQWEQVFNGDYGKSKSTPRDHAKEALHICWGENSYNRLINAGCKNAVITGAIQMDFLKPAFKDWYMDRKTLFSKYGIDPSKKLLLFISSFSYIGLNDDTLNHYKGLSDLDPFYFKELTIDSRKLILEWFERLIDEYPDINIVYRPHPSEMIDDTIMSLCEKHNNILCISDESVKQWILTSDMILNWYSTAGVEAYFAGKYNLFLRPIPLSEQIDYKMFRNACRVDNYEAFKSYVQNTTMLESFYQKHHIGDAISEYYINNGSYSYLEICDQLEYMLNNDKYDLKFQNYSPIRRIYKALTDLAVLAVFNGSRVFPKITQLIRHNKKVDEAVKRYEMFNCEIITPNEEQSIRNKIQRVLAR